MGRVMYTCGTCGRQHNSAQEGRACFEESTTQSQVPSAAGSPPTGAPVRKKKPAPAPRKSTPEKPQKKPQKKRKGKKGSVKKPIAFYVKPEERPGSSPARVQSTQSQRPRISPVMKNHAAPSTDVRSGPTQEPRKPVEPANKGKSRGGKSRRAGEVWQAPSEESKKATPKFDKENRDDYL